MTSVPLVIIHPFSQLALVLHAAPSVETHIVMGALRLNASLRATFALATKVLAIDPNWLPSDASRNDGIAMPSKMPRIATAINISGSVKPCMLDLVLRMWLAR
jgi:hypothetical protein